MNIGIEIAVPMIPKMYSELHVFIYDIYTYIYVGMQTAHGRATLTYTEVCFPGKTTNKYIGT